MTMSRWIAPLLALGVGGTVSILFDGKEYVAANSYARNFDAEEEAMLGYGGKEILLTPHFVENFGGELPATTLRAAKILVQGEPFIVQDVRKLALDGEEYAWQLICEQERKP